MKNLLMASQVVGHRLPLLWMESLGLGRSGRPESERMVTEKMEALVEGMLGAQMEMMSACMAMGTAVLFGKSPERAARKGANRVLRAATRPAERKMRSNVKRLTTNN
jgi:hypothetical protein